MRPGLPGTLPLPELPAENRSALVIATGVYADAQLAGLRAPARDAADLAAVLGDPELGGFEVTSLIDRDAHDIRVGVEEFIADRAPDDLLVVYLSCHGVRDAPGRLYFAAADTRKTLLASTGVESQWVLDRLDECRARRQVLVLDCCFSGAFAVTGGKTGEAEAEGELRRLLVGHGRGRVVLTASRAGEYSYEGQALPGAEIAGSVFTAGLVNGLRTGGADSDNDGLISVEDAYDYAYTYVQAHTAAQTPQRWTYGAEGKIWLARNPTSRSMPTALSQPVSQDPVARNASDAPPTTGGDSYLPAVVGPNRVIQQTESRAAVLARLATAMRASHGIAATRLTPPTESVAVPERIPAQGAAGPLVKAHGEAEGAAALAPQPPKQTAPPTLGTTSSRESESSRQDEAGRIGTRNHRPPGPVTPSVAGPKTTVKASRALVAMNHGGYAMIVACMVFGPWGGVYGLFDPGKPVIGIGSLVIEDNNRFMNAAYGVGSGFVVGMVAFLFGLVMGMFGKPDEITADSTGLTFARVRSQGPLTYQVRWAAIRSIDIVRVPSLLLNDYYAVAVDFRPENTPSAQWQARHGIPRDKSGRYRVYRNAWYRPSSVEPTRLISMLRLHAPQLYNDPENIPDP